MADSLAVKHASLVTKNQILLGHLGDIGTVLHALGPLDARTATACALRAAGQARLARRFLTVSGEPQFASVDFAGPDSDATGLPDGDFLVWSRVALIAVKDIAAWGTSPSAKFFARSAGSSGCIVLLREDAFAAPVDARTRAAAVRALGLANDFRVIQVHPNAAGMALDTATRLSLERAIVVATGAWGTNLGERDAALARWLQGRGLAQKIAADIWLGAAWEEQAQILCPYYGQSSPILASPFSARWSPEPLDRLKTMLRLTGVALGGPDSGFDVLLERCSQSHERAGHISSYSSYRGSGDEAAAESFALFALSVGLGFGDWVSQSNAPVGEIDVEGVAANVQAARAALLSMPRDRRPTNPSLNTLISRRTHRWERSNSGWFYFQPAAQLPGAIPALAEAQGGLLSASENPSDAPPAAPMLLSEDLQSLLRSRLPLTVQGRTIDLSGDVSINSVGHLVAVFTIEGGDSSDPMGRAFEAELVPARHRANFARCRDLIEGWLDALEIALPGVVASTPFDEAYFYGDVIDLERSNTREAFMKSFLTKGRLGKLLVRAPMSS